jgi:hypothetical protein
MLTAIDGDLLGKGKPVGFRIKIWEPATGVLVYDNQAGTDDAGEPSLAAQTSQLQRRPALQSAAHSQKTFLVAASRPEYTQLTLP